MRHEALCSIGLALCLAHSRHITAQEAARPADDEGRGVVHRLPPSTDSFFATQHYTSMTLLHLRGDGTFAEYDREHMFIAVSDEGRWRQTPGGAVQLCSHYQLQPIRVGSLDLYPRADEIVGLIPVASAIEARLSAIQGAGDLTSSQLLPVVVRSWRSKDAFGPPPSGGLSPDIMSDEEHVSRKDLRALAAAIREYVSLRKGNLSIVAPRRFEDLVWLAHDDRPLGKEVVQQYREHKEGAFLPGMVSVAVASDTFASLLGTRQSFMYYPEMNVRIPRRALLADFRQAAVAKPQCGEFEAGATALPSVPVATRTPVPANEDLGFVTEGGAGTTTLVLRADGRFRSYARLEKETKPMDAGEWSRGDDGFVRLCSHASVFRPIEGDRLSLPIDRAIYARLPLLLSTLRSHVASKPGKATFDAKEVERLADRALERTSSDGCGCRRLAYGDEPIERKQLLDFIAALDRYVRSGTANLREQRLYSLGSTAWLGDPAGRSNPEVVRTLLAFGEGPAILPGVFVQVPMTLIPRGPEAMDDTSRQPESTPLCAGFSRPPR